MFDESFDVNVKTTFFVAQHVVSALRDGGRMILIPSLSAWGASLSAPAYSAAKKRSIR